MGVCWRGPAKAVRSCRGRACQGQELQQEEQQRPQAATPRAGFQTPRYSQIKMLCDPVRDGGSEEASSLQPWQIYSGLFLGFWAFSAFFNHFLATALLCLVFGAAGDQLTRYMYTLGSSVAGGAYRSPRSLNSSPNLVINFVK